MNYKHIALYFSPFLTEVCDSFYHIRTVSLDLQPSRQVADRVATFRSCFVALLHTSPGMGLDLSAAFVFILRRLLFATLTEHGGHFLHSRPTATGVA